MAAPRSWKDAMVAAGAVAVSHVPEASLGRTDIDEVAGAEPVEDTTLAVHAVEQGAPAPLAIRFLDGIQLWKVVYYDGVLPIVRAHVAAAVRRRGADRRLRTADEAGRDCFVSCVAALRPAVRAALEESGLELVDLPQDEASQPGRALEAARRAVERARVALEKELGERSAQRLGPGEWLAVDGVLSQSTVLAAHPRALAVIKRHGAQYFAGPELER